MRKLVILISHSRLLLLLAACSSHRIHIHRKSRKERTGRKQFDVEISNADGVLKHGRSAFTVASRTHPASLLTSGPASLSFFMADHGYHAAMNDRHADTTATPMRL